MKIAFNPSTVAALITPPNNKDITFDLRGRNIFARGVKFCGTDTWRDIKINNVSIGSNILDLRNGSNTTLTNTNGVVTINSTWRPVVDNLTSDSTTSSLSANLGRVLKVLIDGKSDSGHNHDDRYLRLTGGWMSGDINFGGDNKIYWRRNTDTASISFKNDGDDDTDSYMSFVTSDNGNEYFRWSHSSGSTNTEWMALRSDGLRVKGTKVSLEGHSHNDLYYTKTEVNNKLNGKSDTSHTHDDRYLKLTGGTMTGNIILSRNVTITKLLSSNSHYSSAVSWSVDGETKKYGREIGLHNMGGSDSTGSIAIVPYKTDTEPWSGTVGLFIAKNALLLDGNPIALKSDIPSSLKNPHSLTLLANGTTLATYDGSVSKIVNLTYDNVGAAAKNHTHNSLEPWASYITGDSHAAALKSIFDKNKTSIPRNKFISMLSSAYGNGTYYMGYFLLGYENNPYGGFFVAHYDTAYYVGILNGSFSLHRLAYSTDIPNSLKNPHALTISLNGTSLGSYDGSAAKNINITPGSIGAATSEHNHDNRYLKLTGGTMQLGEGLKFHADNNYFRTNEDARIISLLDNNDKVCDGGLIIDERATLDGKEYVTELLRIRDSEFKWKGSNILHSGNTYVSNNKGYINNTEITLVNNANYSGSTGKLTSLGNYTYNNLSTDIPINAVSYKIVTSGGTDLGDTQYNVLHIPWQGGNYGMYLLFGTNNGRFGIKHKHSGVVREVLDSSNYTSYAIPTSASCNKNWSYSGQSGQPTWLWGTNDGTNMYVWNPSNFRVAYASSAGNADTLDGIDSTKFLRQVVVPNNTENDFNTFSNMTLTGRVDPTTGASLKNAPWSGSGPAGGYGVLTYLFNGSSYGTQMAWGYGNNRIYIRNKYWGGSGVGAVWETSWNTLALTTDIPSSLKNPYALTLKANGTTLAIYDGSSAREANFTYANIGAASASHSHSNYVTALGTSGNYLTWTKNGNTSNITVPYATSAGYANGIASKGLLDSQEKIDNFLTANRFEYATFKTTESNNVGFASNDGMILSIPWISTTYGAQMAFDDVIAATIKVRCKSTSWGNWHTLLHSGNYNSYSPTLTGIGASGTWGINISGNADSATNADKVDGLHVHSGRNNEANKIVRTDANGYILAGWINTTSGDMGITTATRIYCSNDGYIRYKTPANFFEKLDNDNNQISITIGSQNRKLTVNYASFTKTLDNIGLPSSASNANNTAWCKFARITFNNFAWSTASGYLFFGGGENPDNRAILVYHFRASSTATTLSTANLHWLVKSHSSATVIAVKVSDNVYDLYTNNSGAYMCPRIYHMSAYSSRFAWSVGSWTTTKPTAAYTSSDIGRVYYAENANSVTKVIVNLNTTNDANYPLVWSNLNNSNTVTENLLFKSWSDLYYNPKSKRLLTNRYVGNYANLILTSIRHIDADLNSNSTEHTLYIGYGQQTYTVSTNIYASTGSGDTTNDRYLLALFNTSAGINLNGNINTRPSIIFRSEPSYKTTLSYFTSGNEALCFETKSSATSIIFYNGVTYAASASHWYDLVNGVLIKNNCLAIGAGWASGINPDYKLKVGGNGYFTGNSYATHFYESSDKTLKKNIKSILSSTNIPKIREFDWKDTGEHSYGFIALELEELGYGCLVNEADGKKTVNYTATLALTVAKLLNLINIQNKKISNLTKELKALKYGRKKNS